MTTVQSPRPVTGRNSALCNAELPGPQAERRTPVTSPTTLHSAITVGKRAAVWVRETFTPPALFAEREPGVEQLRRYARRAAYTGETGPMRTAGVAWCHLIATPSLVCSRLGAWVCERPARFIVVAATVKALTELPPVEWAVDHLVKPSADFALWLFL